MKHKHAFLLTKALALLKWQPRAIHWREAILSLGLAFLLSPTLQAATPEIEVFMDGPGGTETTILIPIKDDTSAATPIEFGRTLPNITLTKTFIVNNTGDADLIVSPLETSLLNNTGFGLGGNFPISTIAPGKSFSFTIFFDPQAVTSTAFKAGDKSNATISFFTSDADESPFNFAVEAIVVDAASSEIHLWKGTPEEVFSGLATEVATNATVAFGSTVIGKPVTKTFTILNAGGAPLTIEPPVQVTNVNGTAPFTVDALDAFGEVTTINGLGGSVSFQVTLTANSAGDFSAEGAKSPETVSFNYKEAGRKESNTFSFDLAGTVGPVPDIAVLDGSRNIVKDTGEIDFGTVTINTTEVTKTLTVKNEGGADLILDNPISLTGEKFSLVSENFATATLAPGKTTDLKVKLDSSTPGNFTGTLTLKSNDSDEEPFIFTVKGVVADSVTESEIGIWQVFADNTKQSITSGQTPPVEFQVEIGEAAPVLTFEVKNTGGVSLQLTSLSFNETQFKLTTPFPKTIAAGGSSIFGMVLKNTSQAGVFTTSLKIYNTDGDSGDGVTENPFEFDIRGTVGKGQTSEEGTCFEDQQGILTGQTCVLANNLSASTVDKDGQSLLSDSEMVGGISKSGDTYLTERKVSLADTIAVRGVVKIASADVGKKADVIVAGAHYSNDYPEGFVWYMLDSCQTCIKIWPYDDRNAQLLLSELRPLKTIDALESYLIVDIYSGQFVYPGLLDIFFGYRITEGDDAGKLVFSIMPIQVTIER